MSVSHVSPEIISHVPLSDGSYVRSGFVSNRPPILPTSDLEKMDLLTRFKPDIIGQVATASETIAVVDKSDPHTITDSMISVFGHHGPVVTFADASSEGRQTVLEWLHGFVRYSTDKTVSRQFNLSDSFLRIAVNIDHGTSDRGAIQGLRTLHPHCLCFPNRQQAPVSQLAPQEKLTPTLLTADPLATVGPRILADHFKAGSFSKDVYEHFEQLASTHEHAMPHAFTLRLKDSWDTLLAPGLGDALRDLDLTMANIYRSIRRAVTGETSKPEPWQRPELLDSSTVQHNIDELPLLSEVSRQGLKRVVASLRSVPAPVMARLKESRKAGGISLAEKVLAFADLAYGMNFYAPGTINDMANYWRKGYPAYLAIQPLLRRPSGMAGLNFDPEGNLFQVQRGPNAQQLTPELEAKRYAFHKGFVEFLDIPAHKT